MCWVVDGAASWPLRTTRTAAGGRRLRNPRPADPPYRLPCRMFASLTTKEEMRILMLGLDAAGKTTALYKMRLGEVVTTIPTIGERGRRPRQADRQPRTAGSSSCVWVCLRACRRGCAGFNVDTVEYKNLSFTVRGSGLGPLLTVSEHSASRRAAAGMHTAAATQGLVPPCVEPLATRHRAAVTAPPADVGRRWPEEDPHAVAPLLPWLARADLCGGQQ